MAATSSVNDDSGGSDPEIAEVPCSLGPKKQKAELPREAATKAHGDVQVLQLPKRLKVRCLNKRGVYLVERHRVECQCEEECARKRGGKQVFKMGAFELHAGSSSKKWKWSVCMQSGKKRLSERLDELAGGKVEFFEGPNAWWRTSRFTWAPPKTAGAGSGKSPHTPQKDGKLLFIPFSSDSTTSESAPAVTPTRLASGLGGLSVHKTGAVSHSAAGLDGGRKTLGGKAPEQPSAKGATVKGAGASGIRYQRLSSLHESPRSDDNRGRAVDAAVRKGLVTQGNPALRPKALTDRTGAPSCDAEGSKQTARPSAGPAAAKADRDSNSGKPSLSGDKDFAGSPGISPWKKAQGPAASDHQVAVQRGNGLKVTQRSGDWARTAVAKEGREKERPVPPPAPSAVTRLAGTTGAAEHGSKAVGAPTGEQSKKRGRPEEAQLKRQGSDRDRLAEKDQVTVSKKTRPERESERPVGRSDVPAPTSRGEGMTPRDNGMKGLQRQASGAGHIVVPGVTDRKAPERQPSMEGPAQARGQASTNSSQCLLRSSDHDRDGPDESRAHNKGARDETSIPLTGSGADASPAKTQGVLSSVGMGRKRLDRVKTTPKLSEREIQGASSAGDGGPNKRLRTPGLNGERNETDTVPQATSVTAHQSAARDPVPRFVDGALGKGNTTDDFRTSRESEVHMDPHAPREGCVQREPLASPECGMQREPLALQDGQGLEPSIIPPSREESQPEEMELATPGLSTERGFPSESEPEGTSVTHDGEEEAAIDAAEQATGCAWNTSKEGGSGKLGDVPAFTAGGVTLRPLGVAWNDTARGAGKEGAGAAETATERTRAHNTSVCVKPEPVEDIPDPGTKTKGPVKVKAEPGTVKAEPVFEGLRPEWGVPSGAEAGAATEVGRFQEHARNDLPAAHVASTGSGGGGTPEVSQRQDPCGAGGQSEGGMSALFGQEADGSAGNGRLQSAELHGLTVQGALAGLGSKEDTANRVAKSVGNAESAGQEHKENREAGTAQWMGSGCTGPASYDSTGLGTGQFLSEACPEQGGGEGTGACMGIAQVEWDNARWGRLEVGHSMVLRGDREKCALTVPVSVGGKVFMQTGEIAQWARSTGALGDIEKETGSGKRALLREYVAACAAFYTEYAVTSSKLPDFDAICMFVSQRADFDALKAEEADLVPLKGRTGSGRDHSQGGRLVCLLEDYLQACDGFLERNVIPVVSLLKAQSTARRPQAHLEAAVAAGCWEDPEAGAEGRPPSKEAAAEGRLVDVCAGILLSKGFQVLPPGDRALPYTPKEVHALSSEGGLRYLQELAWG